MHNQKGFTLIELLVVVSIIALLSSIVITGVSSARAKARIRAVQQTLGAVKIAALGCVQANGTLNSPLSSNTGGGSICSTTAIAASYVWPALPTAGSWTYGTPVTPSNGDFTYSATGDGVTINCNQTGCR